MTVTNRKHGGDSNVLYREENDIDLTNNGFTKIDSMGNDKIGFYAAAYKRGEDIIISYHGSEDNKPQECEDALAYYSYIRKKYPGANIMGHSLGVTMVQYVDNTMAIKDGNQIYGPA